MDKLLTKKDLAERWQVTEQSIDNWRKEGLISNCKGVPAVRFSPQHIAELEGVKLEKFSPLEKRRLERENEELKIQNERLKEIISKVLMNVSEAVNY